MSSSIVEFFQEHGPMTVSEAISRGLGNVCNTCYAQPIRARLNELVSSGQMVRCKQPRHLVWGIGSYSHRSNVFVYKVKQQ